MGTSLTGLTPATTYDALIKLSDNEPLGATAKYIGDGLGNDSVLSLSTTKVGIGTSAPTATVEIKGSGSTSATTSFLVQNSASAELLKVTDNGLVTGLDITATNNLRGANGRLLISNIGNELRITNALVGNYFKIGPDNTCGVDNIFTTPTLNAGNLAISKTTASSLGSTMSLKSFIMANIGISNGLTINSNYTNNGASGPNFGRQVRFTENLTPIATQLDITFAYMDPTINYTAGATGKVVGFDFNPVLTSVTAGLKIRAFQCSTGGVYINTTTYQDSACLQADSTTQGFLPPRMTTTQKNAIATPATGLIVMDITTFKLCVYNGTSWVDLH
jgi:hypothetical protein